LDKIYNTGKSTFNHEMLKMQQQDRDNIPRQDQGHIYQKEASVQELPDKDEKEVIIL
jgi:hypothetical protein